MGSIFEKQARLKPSTMATVAQRRFEDAEALSRTGDNARANGTAYLAGFVIEILLKARLVETFETIARKRPHQVLEAEREVWSLIWKSHDLDGMLTKMRNLQAALKSRGERDGFDYLNELRKVCAEWTVQARYSPRTMRMDEAVEILDRVRLLKEVLR
jgi:hypothetical protein